MINTTSTASTGTSTYVSINEAAHMLSMSTKALYTALYADRLPGVTRFGRAIRIHRPTLERRALSGQILLDKVDSPSETSSK
jgi:predicted DNA-binding transcriptional regulator AlpA